MLYQFSCKLQLCLAEELGKNRPLPYKDVDAGRVDVIGLPNWCGKLKTLGHYGEKKLMELIQAIPSLTFKMNDR